MTSEIQSYDLFYDGEGDFLEITFGEPAQEGTTEEMEHGIFITRDIGTGEIKNVGILDFKKRIDVLKKTLNTINMTLPFELSVPSSALAV